jgi:hypothetical protein
MNSFEFSIENNAIKCIDCNTWILDQTVRAIPCHVSTTKHIKNVNNSSNNTNNNDNNPIDNNVPNSIIAISQRENVINNLNVIFYICKKVRTINDFNDLLSLIT